MLSSNRNPMNDQQGNLPADAAGGERNPVSRSSQGPGLISGWVLMGLALVTVLFAQNPLDTPAPEILPASNTLAQPEEAVDSIPHARDEDYPGTMTLEVDATDTARGIMRIKQRIPVAEAGPLVLLYPKWLPGNHAPSGPIDKLAGLRFSAGGKPLVWRRDAVDVFAFHVEVPEGATAVDAEYQYLSPTATDQGRIVVTPVMMNLQWNAVSLYPAGWFVRRIPVSAAVTWPAGWTVATALRPRKTVGSRVEYGTVNYETLVDSPVFAGLHARIEKLSPDVTLNIFADQPEQLAATPEQFEAHRNLVTESLKLFGSQHYDHYDFLLAMSERQGGIGLEHHRSSENGVASEYFTKWDDNAPGRDLLPHEFVHSWNGKFRRGADLWTPDYRTPMRDSLLWLYEGQTQFWGYILAARSGLWTRQQTLDALAGIAAAFDTRAGRLWRPVADTTHDPIISGRRPQPWRSWQRGEDYYREGLLIWLDADSLIREKTDGAKSLDDFASAFFGINDRDWGELTYRFEDVVATLNGVLEWDWEAFLNQRVNGTTSRAPLDGLTRGGYQLVYRDTPTEFFKKDEAKRKISDLSYSFGLVTDNKGVVKEVMWDGPAFNAGLTAGTEIVAIGGRAWTEGDLKAAITAAKGAAKSISLLVKTGDLFRTVEVQWNGGLRYPALERTAPQEENSRLEALLAPKL
ncbi:MAG: trypsin-like serine protease [Verrucomicrobiales bacterium]|nr:trypsin-like serine protease [Verrucomicrobiales bacterium]